MSAPFVVLIVLVICGISAASFATDRNRNQAAWFVIGLLTGPLGLLVLLLLVPLPEAKKGTKGMKGNRVALTLLMFLAVIAVIVMGLAEVVAQFHAGQETKELASWERYGDALIRFAQNKDVDADAFVLKATRDQIADHHDDLAAAMHRTEDQLLLAVRGLKPVEGAQGILINAYRLITFRSTEWPAMKSLSARDQAQVITMLEERLKKYRQYLQTITQAQSMWLPASVQAP